MHKDYTYNLPYEKGQWDYFFDSFLNLCEDNKFILYSLPNIASYNLIEEGSDLEKRKDSGTAYIDMNKNIFIYESFLLKNKINVYEFTTVIMHEVLHYALGHLKLFKAIHEEKKKASSLEEKIGQINTRNREHMITNIVTDAIINSTISKAFNFDKDMTSLFTKLYSEDGKRIDPATGEEHSGYENFLRPFSTFEDPYKEAVYEDLYSPDSTTYNEIRSAIEEDCPEGAGGVIFIGGHGEEGMENEDEDFSKELEDFIKDMSDALDSNDGRLPKESCGPGKYNPDKGKTAEHILKEFLQEIKDYGFYDNMLIVATEGDFNTFIEKDLMRMDKNNSSQTVIPNPYDRSGILAMTLGMYKPFYEIALPEQRAQVCAYIDVSGSTTSYHKVFLSAIRYSLERFSRIFEFSTYVHECTPEDIEKGVIRTSGGNDACLYRHMKEHNITKAVVFSDGQHLEHVKKDECPENLELINVYMDRGYTDGYITEILPCIVSRYIVSPTGEFKMVDNVPISSYY